MNMRWTKASERKPEEGNKVFIRWKHRLTKQDEWEVLYDTSRVFGDAKFWELEWLDESSSPSPLKDVIEEMEEKKNLLYQRKDVVKEELQLCAVMNQIKVHEYYLPKLKQVGEGSESYWKKRCEQLTEALETVASKTNHIVLSYGGMNFNNPVANKIIDEVSAKVNEVCNYAIEQLKSSIGEETEGQDGWISVEDRLPEKTGMCLVNEINHGKSYVDTMKFHGYNKSWTNDVGDEFHPTHWQPLPKPPKPTK